MNRIYSASPSIRAFVNEIPSISFENKKIMILAVAAFGFIAACYLALWHHRLLRKHTTQQDVINEQSSPLASETANLNPDDAKYKSPIINGDPAFVKTTPPLEKNPKVETPKTPIKEFDFADLFPDLNAHRVESDDNLRESDKDDYPFEIVKQEMWSPFCSPLSSPFP